MNRVILQFIHEKYSKKTLVIKLFCPPIIITSYEVGAPLDVTLFLFQKRLQGEEKVTYSVSYQS